MSLPQILTITLNPTIDITADVDELQPDAKIRCRNARYEPGGGGVNVARVIKELGGASTAFVMAGGPTGSWLQAMLAGIGIDQHIFRSDGLTRPTFQVNEQATGRMFRFVLPGPEADQVLSHRLFDTMEALLAGGTYRWVILSGSLPPGIPDDLLPHLARACADRQIRLIVDTSGPALRALMGAGVYLIKPNREEITSLRACMPGISGSPEALAKELIRLGTAEVVVVTLGAAGAIVVTQSDAIQLSAPEVVARSAVGAGDSFLGALTLALARGRSLADACRFGIAAGAAAVLTPGTELCRRADVDALMEQMGSRSNAS